MKKALLVNLPFKRILYEDARWQVGCELPLGLAYIASFLRGRDIPVDVLDANAMDYYPDEVAGKIISHKADLVGFTTTTMTMPAVSRVITQLREAGETAKVAIGGPHVSFAARQTLSENPGIDFVVSGEGEETTEELMRAMECGSQPDGIKGLAFRRNGSIIVNEPRPAISDINVIPFPARDMFPQEHYAPGSVFNLGFTGRQYATIITSRGCPSRCTYCSSRTFWKTFRMRSAENIIGEMEHLVKGGVKQIYFLDDTLTASRQRLHKICEHIINKRWNIKWLCYSRVNAASDDSLRLMRRSGCYCIIYGIESGDQDVLNGIKKGITLDAVRRAVYMTKKNNIIANCSFMFGLPGETERTMEATVSLAKEINPQLAAFYFTTPFPGTDLYDEARQKGWLAKDMKWQDFSFNKGYIMDLPGLSREMVNKKVQEAYKRFYFRMRYFTQALFFIFKNPILLKIYFKGAVIMFRGLCAKKENRG